MSDYRRAKQNVELTVGESVRTVRELQELSQNELAELTGIPQSTISAIERDRVKLGVERAKVLARALKVHPSVLVFPGWGREPRIRGLRSDTGFRPCRQCQLSWKRSFKRMGADRLLSTYFVEKTRFEGTAFLAAQGDEQFLDARLRLISADLDRFTAFPHQAEAPISLDGGPVANHWAIRRRF